MGEADSKHDVADVDDTIKVTQTSSPVGILRSTFVVSQSTEKSAKR